MPYQLPTTIEALEKAGYVFERRSSCSGCGKTIEWWRTPAGFWLPVEYVEFATARIAHIAVCKNANQFRKKQSREAVKAEAPKKPKAAKVAPAQKTLFRMAK